jgi:putative transposase
VSSVPLQPALRHQHKAFTAFFARRVRYPRFKSRRGRQCAHYTRSAFTLRGGELRLAKTPGPLRFTWSWPEVDVAALDPTMVVVSREPDGRWYVTFAVDTHAPEPLEPAGHAVGVDLGVTDLAVTRTASGSPNRGTWRARPATWPATSGAWPAAGKARRTGPKPRRR